MFSTVLNVVPTMSAEAPAVDLERRHFTGGVRVRDITADVGGQEIKLICVHFDAGARSRPHLHTEHDQYLIYVSGTGVVAMDGGEDVHVSAGSVVCLPKGHLHMHGATDDGPASHLSFLVDYSDLVWDPPVPDTWRQFMST
ncbi:MAG TPA: cupin domain-containing protein [Solirubrobacteraceae bacterium]|jgi:quercetin dioxygenase-like cupin family protein